MFLVIGAFLSTVTDPGFPLGEAPTVQEGSLNCPQIGDANFTVPFGI